MEVGDPGDRDAEGVTDTRDTCECVAWDVLVAERLTVCDADAEDEDVGGCTDGDRDMVDERARVKLTDTRDGRLETVGCTDLVREMDAACVSDLEAFPAVRLLVDVPDIIPLLAVREAVPWLDGVVVLDTSTLCVDWVTLSVGVDAFAVAVAEKELEMPAVVECVSVPPVWVPVLLSNTVALLDSEDVREEVREAVRASDGVGVLPEAVGLPVRVTVLVMEGVPEM